MTETISFKLNNQPVTLEVDTSRPLLWVLRSDLETTGTKHGCGEGLCGTCTVMVNGEAVLSCQASVKEVAGKEVVTIEGLAENGELHPLQKAFIEHEALQCGFCTSGMIIKALALLSENLEPSREEIISRMDGNLCRCGSHTRIVRAVESAAMELRAGRLK
jgi:carbon-monoxide dehydrogenase small subunit